MSKKDNYFLNYDVIVLIDAMNEDMYRVDSLCREKNLKFLAGNVYGFFGYSFSDLSQHTYAEEIKQFDDQGDGERPTKKIKVETKIIQKTMEFDSLKDCLEKDWTDKKLRTLCSSYFILKTLLKFQSTKERRPACFKKTEDVAALLQLNDEICSDSNFCQDRINRTIYNSVFATVSPVCAIVGGVLAQEVIKAVSCKDAPHNNFFFFNALEDSGIVECVTSD